MLINILIKMITVMENITDHNAADVAWYYKGVVEDVDGWFLMGTPWPVLTLWISYLLFVLKLGPAYMDKRPAFQLKTPLVLYNLFQIMLSCYIFYLGSSVLQHYGILSSTCAVDEERGRPIITFGVYVYLLAKISELFDTVFFVLRKKMNQVTFLHVYHHSLMMLSTWFALKYNPTDALVFLGTLNSLVHVVMYSYYGLSAFPSLAKYLWWKRYITTFQLVQFGFITLHALIGTFVSNCQTSFVLLFDILFNCGLMIYLFRDFYIKSYVKKEISHDKSKRTAGKDKKFENGDITNIVRKDRNFAQQVKSKGIC